MYFNINSDEVVDYTRKLEKLSRSALPLAIKGTLNKTGLAMKQRTMPAKAKEIFKERQPNFFRANSRVEFAQGYSIPDMVAMVGFVSSGLHSPATNYAVRDLEQQEYSGMIHGRSFKALPDARKGKSYLGNVRANARISQILKAGNVINAHESKTTGTGSAGHMQSFIKASVHAGIGGYVLGDNVLWRVTGLRRLNFGQTTEFKKQKLYSFKKDGTAKVHAHGFMRKAALEAQKEMEMNYRIEFQRQWQKVHGKFHSFY